MREVRIQMRTMEEALGRDDKLRRTAKRMGYRACWGINGWAISDAWWTTPELAARRFREVVGDQ